MKTGTADLPLHHGHVPAWLAGRMARLGRVVVEALVLEYGRDEVLRRLANPFWFQALGCVMGMDWHSSGITTSVLGALKRGLAPVEWELGLHVCGGRGRHSRQTPAELLALGERVSVDAPALVRASRLVAKVDSAAVQDGFALYLHGFVVTDDGKWTVVQQGMNPDRRQARRYHWLWERAGSFVDAPHAAIEGIPQGSIVNFTDRQAAAARTATVALANRPPEAVLVEVERAARLGARTVVFGSSGLFAGNCGAEFPELLLTPCIGGRTLFALSLVAEVVYGAPSRFSDPARFSFAHGGKDGHPFPVPLTIYDETLAVLRRAVTQAKLGQDEKLAALRRLDEQCRTLEAAATGHSQRAPALSLPAIISDQRRRAPAWDGRTCFGSVARRPRQLRLPFAT